jgi:hypothetical protein
MTTLAERTKLIKPSVTLAIAAKAGKLRAEGVDPGAHQGRGHRSVAQRHD